MPITPRSLEETLSLDGQDNVVLVSGKGGVGKSTIAAALALLSSNDNITQLIDLDAAHSSLDSLGVEESETTVREEHNQIYEISDRFRVLLFTAIIKNPRTIDDLNRQLNALVQDTGILPILRLAVHSRFFGIPSDHKAMAYIIQLIEVLESKRYLQVDHGDPMRLEVKDLEPAAGVSIIDSENTQGLMSMLDSLQFLGKALLNLRERADGSIFNPSNLGFQTTIGRQPNIKEYLETSAGKSPDNVIEVMENFVKRMHSTRTKIVIVTNPGRNEVHQTAREVECLNGKVDHILMNRWADSDEARHWESHLLDRLAPHINGTNNVGYSRVELDKPLNKIDPIRNNMESSLCIENLETIAKSFSKAPDKM